MVTEVKTGRSNFQVVFSPIEYRISWMSRLRLTSLGAVRWPDTLPVWVRRSPPEWVVNTRMWYWKRTSSLCEFVSDRDVEPPPPPQPIPVLPLSSELPHRSRLRSHLASNWWRKCRTGRWQGEIWSREMLLLRPRRAATLPWGASEVSSARELSWEKTRGEIASSRPPGRPIFLSQKKKSSTSIGQHWPFTTQDGRTDGLTYNSLPKRCSAHGGFTVSSLSSSQRFLKMCSSISRRRVASCPGRWPRLHK